mgnify:CR=1 FL=1
MASRNSTRKNITSKQVRVCDDTNGYWLGIDVEGDGGTQKHSVALWNDVSNGNSTAEEQSPISPMEENRVHDQIQEPNLLHYSKRCRKLPPRLLDYKIGGK